MKRRKFLMTTVAFCACVAKPLAKTVTKIIPARYVEASRNFRARIPIKPMRDADTRNQARWSG